LVDLSRRLEERYAERREPLSVSLRCVARRFRDARARISLAQARIGSWPGEKPPKWHGRLAVPPPSIRSAGRYWTQYRCTPSEARSVAIRSRDARRRMDDLICGTDLAAGNAAVRRILAGIRFTK
jgi:hypothetical protein